MLEFLEKFQEGIVGIIGFAGVILTLYFNARLERQKREETLRDERASIKAALISELRIIKNTLDDSILSINKGELDGSPSVLVPTDTISSAYDALLPKIGLLPADGVISVMDAYLAFQEMRMNLTLVPGATNHDQRRVAIPSRSFYVLKGMMQNLLPRIDKAIDVLRD